jgi:hypothetical protein
VHTHRATEVGEHVASVSERPVRLAIGMVACHSKIHCPVVAASPAKGDNLPVILHPDLIESGIRAVEVGVHNPAIAEVLCACPIALQTYQRPLRRYEVGEVRQASDEQTTAWRHGPPEGVVTEAVEI